MRALLIQGASPPTYWGYEHTLPFIARDVAMAPLGVAALAARLPSPWDLRVRNLRLGPVSDDELRWADVVLLSGMLVQGRSMREVLTRARRLGRLTVVGGPAPTTSPDLFPEAAYLFLGEAEERLGRLVEAIERPGHVQERVLSPPGEARPSTALARAPCFDLLDLGRHASLAVHGGGGPAPARPAAGGDPARSSGARARRPHTPLALRAGRARRALDARSLRIAGGGAGVKVGVAAGPERG